MHRYSGLHYLLDIEGFGFECWDMDFLVPLLGLSEGATGQLAPLVGHEMAAVCEDHVLQIQHLARTKLWERGTEE